MRGHVKRVTVTRPLKPSRGTKWLVIQEWKSYSKFKAFFRGTVTGAVNRVEGVDGRPTTSRARVVIQKSVKYSETSSLRKKVSSRSPAHKNPRHRIVCISSSSSRMHVINHNLSAMKQRLHSQSVAEISRHSVLSGDRIRQCETSSGSRHKDTDQCL